jgi:protein TonB
MTDAGFYDDRFLTPPAENDGIKTSTLLLVGLFHLAMAGLLLNSWTPAHQDEPKVSTIKIQMLRLSKPVPEIKPVEPVPMAIPEPVQPVFEPTPVAQKTPEPKPVVENELAFKRVEEKPIPKEVKPEPIKQKIEKPETKVVEKVVKQPEKQIVQPAEPITTPPLPQQAKAIETASKSTDIRDTVQSTNNTEAFSVERYKPIEKQAPEYPRGALRKGLEGDCTVRYTVNTKGEVESPEVLANCHPLFKKPSLEAAKTFRYSPRMVNGNAVAVNNVHNTFEYRIH